MPELPDVEVFRRYFEQTSFHKKITRVQVREQDMLGEASLKTFRNRLQNSQFQATMRHGKYLFAETDNKDWLVLHFGMTGYIRYYTNEEETPKHSRLLLDFDNGSHLAYVCQRKLGLFDLTNDYRKYIEKKEFGIDPFRQKIDFSSFLEMIKGRRGTVKSTLMNQQLIAGIGNVYSDEILFQAGIHPGSQINKLDDGQLKTIFAKIKEVIEVAISKDVDPDRFPDSYLLPHRNAEEECPLCSGKIEKSTIAGRSSYYCPRHQKKID